MQILANRHSGSGLYIKYIEKTLPLKKFAIPDYYVTLLSKPRVSIFAQFCCGI